MDCLPYLLINLIKKIPEAKKKKKKGMTTVKTLYNCQKKSVKKALLQVSNSGNSPDF